MDSSISTEVVSIKQTKLSAALDSKLSRTQITQLRFVFGMTLSISIAYGFEWFLSYILPTCVCVLLSLPLPNFSFKTGIRYMIEAVMAFVFAFAFSLLFLNYPLVFILALAIVIFHLYYYLNKGGQLWIGFISIIFMVIVPILTNSQRAFAIGFSSSLIIAVCLSIVILWLSYLIFPSEINKTSNKVCCFQKGYSQRAAVTALKNTVILLPLMISFIFFDLSSYLLVMVYSVMYTLKPELSAGKEAGFKSIISTCIAGVLTFFLYWLIVAVPEYYFFVILMFVVSLIFSLQIFKKSPNAKYFSSSFNALIILLSQGMAQNTNYTDLLFTRISLICLAITYIVIALKSFEHYFPSNKLKTV